MQRSSVKKKMYRAAVIGCGMIGMTAEADRKRLKPATHAGAFFRNSRTALVGLCDADPKKRLLAARLFPGIPFFMSAEEMFRAVQPDIVSIATHPDSHREYLALALQHKVRAIMCEKPLADSVKDGERIVRLAAKHPRTAIFVNHMRRFDPLLRKTAAKLRLGHIGTVLQSACYYTKGIRNNGTHIIDLLRYFLGDIAWVYGVRGNAEFHLPGDENIDALLKFKSGALASLHALEDRAYGIHDLHFYGTKGALRITRYGFEVEWRSVRPSRDYKNFNELTPPVLEGDKRSFFAPMAAHVVRVLDGKEQPLSTPADGLAALRVIEALFLSAKTGRKVTLNE